MMKSFLLTLNQLKQYFRTSGFRCPGLRLGCLALLIIMISGLSQAARADDDDNDTGGVKFSQEAAGIFNKRCTACHTYGKGVKVGPDLKDVNNRRKLDWLLKFIHASSSVIKSGDPIATALFAQFKQQRMPDWTDLSDQQIKDILHYVAVGGPDIKPADERNAVTATAEEIEKGRKLFHGQMPLKYGAKACVVCHTVQGEGMGGSLGPNLTNAYFKYQDRALAEFLRHPCFQFDASNSENHYLTPKESFAIKSFLWHVALRAPEHKASNRNTSSTTSTQIASGSAAPGLASPVSEPGGTKR